MEIKEFLDSLESSNFSLAVDDEKLVLKGDHTKLNKEEIAAIRSNDFVISYIKENKAALVQYLSEKSGNGQKTSRTKNLAAIYPLTGLQHGLLFHGLFDKKSGSYVIQFSCDLHDPDLEIFKKSWNYIISKHTILRTAFFHDSFNVPVQGVHKEVSLPLQIFDYSALPTEQQLNNIRQFEKDDRLEGFDFSRSPVMRITLMKLSEHRYHLLWTWHHVLFDGWSTVILLEELLETYGILIAGKQLSPIIEDRFHDHIKYLGLRDKEEEKEYWSQYLDNVEDGTFLPFIRSTKDRNKGIGTYKIIRRKMDANVSDKIDLLSKQFRITANTIMQAVWAYCLHRYTGKARVVFGITVSGRPDDLPAVERRVGMFINTIPLQCNVQRDQKIFEWLKEIQEDQVASRKFQYSALQEIREWCGLEGDLFDTTLTFQNFPVAEVLTQKKWHLEVENVHSAEQNNYPFSLTIDHGEELTVQLMYNSDLLPEFYAKEMLAHFENILLQILAKPEGMLSELRLISNAEQDLLQSFNSTPHPLYENVNLKELFESQVEKNPDQIAIIFEEKERTYSQLNNTANRIARQLIDQDVTSESIVPLFFQRSEEMIAAVLGVLKTGAVYVPIDSDYPKERIQFIIDDISAKVILTHKNVSQKLQDIGDIKIIDVSTDEEQSSDEKFENPDVIIQPDGLTYIIYTSGSTGTPKGVMIRNRSLINYLLNTKTRYIDYEEDCSGSYFHLSYSFDASVTAMFMPLLAGKRLVIASPKHENVFDDSNLVKYAPYSFIKTTPSYLPLLGNDAFASNGNWLTRKLVVGGEALHRRHFQYLIDKSFNVEIINEYGPTEATVGCSTYSIKTKKLPLGIDHGIPIGKPIDNTQIYVLNEYLELSPVGVPGELFIGGAGVAKGYVNKEKLSGEKFIKDVIPNSEGDKLYRTGDAGRWLPDGNLEFLGRLDDQVKIRGFRIELDEITSVLRQCNLITDATVIVTGNDDENKYIVAYYVPAVKDNKDEIKTFLESRLPQYMVPAFLVEIESLPLTSNGKIDKKALPDPGTKSATENFQAPRSEFEEQLVGIWQTLLEEDNISIHDDFFERGGHSLSVIRLISMMRKKLGVEVSMNDIFDHPTIASLAAKIEGEESATTLTAIEIGERPSLIPLSYSQERMWFIDRLEGSKQYHLPAVLKLRGKLNIEALQYALKQLVTRHEALGTVFTEIEGKPYQTIKDPDGITLNISKWKGGDAENIKFHIEELIAKPFDLSTDYMLRADLLHLNDDDHMLVVTMHHIASDAWSMSIIVKEVVAYYNAFTSGVEPGLAPLPFQYADYAVWQRKNLTESVLDEKLVYWKEKLADVSTLRLPEDFPRPMLQSRKGATCNFELDSALSKKIRSLGKETGATLFMTLLSVFKILLYRYSGQVDICVGTSVAQRQHQELENLIGFFINTLALRTTLLEGVSFNDLLQEVKKTTLEAYEHQDVPFEKVVDAVVKDRDKSRSPVFQVMFVLNNNPEAVLHKLGDAALSNEDFENNVSKFDITFFMVDSEDGLKGSVQYRPDLYSHSSIERMTKHFITLFSSIINNPQQEIDTLQMLTDAEEKELTVELNNSSVEYPRDVSLVDLFEKLAVNSPDEIAIVFQDKSLTYKELNERANQVGHYLQTRGLSENKLIPLCIERSPEMLVGLLGILKAGCAYVPIEPDFPASRIEYILKDINAEILVSGASTDLQVSEEVEIEMLNIDVGNRKLNEQPASNTIRHLLPGDLAYVIYTSGSTGQPKGVMIEHRSIVDYVYGLKSDIEIDKCNSYALVSSIATDLGNTVIFSSLVFGGALHLYSKKDVMNPGFLQKYFAEHQVDCLKIVPSHWKAISTNEDLLIPDRLLIFGGEILPGELVEEILTTKTTCQIINHYGPTETTIGKLIYHTLPENKPGQRIPIGQTFSNSQVYVLSKAGRLCPKGIPGELHIAGDGLARGYLNNTSLTHQKFVKNPFSEDGASRMYCTGDLAKYLEDGKIAFLGRVDDQLKIRGYRVEPGEIETAIVNSGMVDQAVVLPREMKDGSKQLVGYINEKEGSCRNDLMTYLQEKLPEYMIPDLWVEIDKFPLLPNGKVDRKALPDPEMSAIGKEDFQAPANEIEKKLAALWEDVLEVEQVGTKDNFFELGGHSLLAVRLVSAIRKTFNVEMPIGDIFDYPTVKGQADQIQNHSGKSGLPQIVVQTKGERIPLSFSQERLWFIHKLQGSIQYHVPAVLKIEGPIRIDALGFALKKIVERHEVLRTVISEEEGESFQVIKKSEGWNLSVIDHSGSKPNDESLRNIIGQMISQPFDLSVDYMLRAMLINLNDQEHLLIVTLHHIASDGWSKSILVRELVALYHSFLGENGDSLRPLEVQYADYSIWQRKYLDGAALQQQLSYWKDKLEGLSPLQLPTDFARPPVQSNRGGKLVFTIPKKISDYIYQLSRKHDCTVFMTLLSAFQVLLYRYSGQTDICVGTPIANRSQQELEGLIGFFANTLALRNNLQGDLSFEELLKQARQTTLEAYEHQETPFEKVVEMAEKSRDTSRNPVFQVMFVLRNTPEIPQLNIDDLTISPVEFEHSTAIFDLILFITESDEGYHASFEYSADLFRRETIERMIEHFQVLLSGIIEQPGNLISELPLLTAAEESQILNQFNNTGAAYPGNKSIIDLFESQVENTSNLTALVFDEKHLSYQELNQRSNQLARFLKDRNIGEGDLVAISIDRSFEMIIGVLGILKSGAAYVPVDPEYPEERRAFIIREVRSGILLTTSFTKASYADNSGFELIEIDTNLEIQNKSADNLNLSVDPESLVYVLYTSGSTGVPKGVQMPGRAMINLLNWQDKEFTNKHRRVLQFASLNFDVSFQEIFSTLCFGSELHLIDSERRKDASLMFADMRVQGITHLFIPFIVLKNLAEYVIHANEKVGLQEIIVAGEQLKLTEDVVQFIRSNNIRLVNQYGPTEAHVVSSFSVDPDELVLLPPIGKPIDNVNLYILDGRKNIVPIGIPGELFIGGVQVAKGYLNRTELNAEKFVENLFPGEGHAKYYNTGDLARWLPDGNIEYLGRVDDQVKIRGYRIELGEIESILLESDFVRQAVVLAKTDNIDSKRLVSYIVPEGYFNRDQIIAFAQSRLPEYMVPSVWIEMNSMPITRNGKIDKRALPGADVNELLAKSFIAPRNNVENSMAATWMRLLKVDRVGIHDNFFELGGHSLLATRVIAAIRKELNVEVAIKDLFLYPTIARLAESIKNQNETILAPAIPVLERPELIPLSFSQERLWFIDRMEGSLHYHMPAVLRLVGNLEIEILEKTFKTIIQRHEILRTVFLQHEGIPYQHINGSRDWALKQEDISEFKNDKNLLKEYIASILTTPFDLSKDYMLKAHILMSGPEEAILVLNAHHIAMDGWSISILVKEIVELYSAYSQIRVPSVDPLPIQYADFAIWQRERLSTAEIFNTQLSYWKLKLGDLAPLEFPTDFPRPALQSLRGSVETFEIDAVSSRKLYELGKETGTTLFMTLLAAFKVLLYRYTSQSDICVGTPIAGRLQQETEGLIGFFINTLALRSDVNGDEDFISLLEQVRNVTLEAYSHQEIPFEKVVDTVVKERDLSRTPLFNMMFVLQNTPEVSELSLGEVTLTAESNEQTFSKFDLSFFVIETPQGLKGSIQYCIDLFLPATIRRLIGHFQQIIFAITAQPEQKISLIPMLSVFENTELLTKFNQTSRPYPLEKSLVTLFEEQVKISPNAPALVFEDNILNYQELNQKANQVAHFLRRKGVREKALIPFCIERTPLMIIGLLGILKAGATYIPVDPEYPIDRVNYMIADSGAKVVLSSKYGKQKLLENPGFAILDLDVEQDSIAKESVENPGLQIDPNDLAYVIYTSGSTGKPKGVMIENQSLVNLLFSMKDDVQFTSSSSFLSVTTFSFDICYLEFYLPLITGGKLLIIPRETAIDGFRLASDIKSYHPTHMQATPATWLLLLDNHWENEENLTILIGGEAVKEDIKNKLTGIGNVYNVYGPTETTIWSSLKKLNRNERVSIGKPIANTSIFILSKDLQIAPVGVLGEICIAGVGLARGYLNRPELTAEKFINDPFLKNSCKKLYKTGDIGRWNADGNIECFGRLDDQVKIRGYRIELGEIETAILQTGLAAQVAVVIKEGRENEKMLTAYFKPAREMLKEKEQSLSQSRVDTWKEINETKYAQVDQSTDIEFDINIWRNSFNGELISKEHMREWVNDIVAEVLKESPENVMEIGIGSGLIFYNLITHIKKYTGTDISHSSIDRIVQSIQQSERKYGEAHFKVCPAHEIAIDKDEKIDTILLNSVIQYFPGEDYMTDVIGKCIRQLQGNGRIVIGDVRDNRLLSLFKGRILLDKLQHSLNLQQFSWAVNQELMKEEELCFSPEYFYALKITYPEIAGVEIKWKQVSYTNELSAFRYTVVLHLGHKKRTLSPEWKTLKEAGGKKRVINRLEDSVQVIALKHLPNPRLKNERVLNQVLSDKSVNSIGEILKLMQIENDETNDTNDIIEYARSKNYQFTLYIDKDPLKMNLFLQLNPSNEIIERPAGEDQLTAEIPFTNTPLFSDIALVLHKELRETLHKKLPVYMIPVDFIPLLEFPLTNNLKIDRKFLAQQHDKSSRNSHNYQAPETEIQIMLSSIWQGLLGLEKVGTSDNFFELGGHSLMAMRVISAIRDQLDIELAIKDIFQFTTISELSKYVELQLNVYAEEDESNPTEFDTLYI